MRKCQHRGLYKSLEWGYLTSWQSQERKYNVHDVQPPADVGKADGAALDDDEGEGPVGECVGCTADVPVANREELGAVDPGAGGGLVDISREMWERMTYTESQLHPQAATKRQVAPKATQS